jgi:hypothetical protein
MRNVKKNEKDLPVRSHAIVGIGAPDPAQAGGKFKKSLT